MLECAGDYLGGDPLPSVGGTKAGISVQYAVEAYHLSLLDSWRHHHQHLTGILLRTGRCFVLDCES